MIKILEKKGKEVRIEIEGEDHTFLVPLTSKLLENKAVDIATYKIEHSMGSNSIIYVKMKKGNPLEAINLAASSLKLEFDEFESKYKAAIV